jgi:tripartite-type tricarboxylate transporter receptor subunit TctC
MAAPRPAPSKLIYASSGIGASTRLAAAQFATAASLDRMHVPYRGQPLR